MLNFKLSSAAMTDECIFEWSYGANRVDFGQDKISYMRPNISNWLLDIAERSKHIQEQFWEHSIHIFVHEHINSGYKDLSNGKNIKF